MSLPNYRSRRRPSNVVGFHGQGSRMLSEMMGDAPFCESCGHITVRNGACFICINESCRLRREPVHCS